MNPADWNHEIAILAGHSGLSPMDWNHGIAIPCPNRSPKIFLPL